MYVRPQGPFRKIAHEITPKECNVWESTYGKLHAQKCIMKRLQSKYKSALERGEAGKEMECARNALLRLIKSSTAITVILIPFPG